MIGCHRCGKENQDHYKFCLGCGAELTSAPKAPEVEVGMMKTMLAEPARAPLPGAVSVQPRITPGSDPGSLEPEVPTRVGQPPGVGIKPQVAAPTAQPAPAWTAPPLGQPAAKPAPGLPGVAPGGLPGLAPGGLPGVAPGGLPGLTPVKPPGMAPSPGGLPGVSPMKPSGGLPGVAAAAPIVQPAAKPAAEIARTCPSCQSEVPPAFKFCGVCGCKLPDDAAEAPVVPAASVKPKAIMTLIRPDGSEGGLHELADGENTIGRNHGAIFENDGYLSPIHAVIHVDAAAGTATIADLGSLNGVFVKMTQEEDILPGQIIRIGQELLRFDIIAPPEPTADGTEVMGSPNPGYWGKLTVVIGKDVDGSSYPLLGDSVTLGRERGEINFPDDGYVSGLHARLSTQGERVVLTDLGSSNGTFIKIGSERLLGHNSFVLLGQQLFRLSLTR